MPVQIRVATLRLVNVSNGQIFNKNSNTTKLSDMLNGSTEPRVYANGTGFCESPNVTTHPSIEEYLALEAGDDFALAYFDQNRIITQQIT